MTYRSLPTFDEYPVGCTEEQATAIDLAGCQEFVDANPDYYRIDTNTTQLRIQLLGHPLTRFNLEFWFHELRAQGKIIERPASPQETLEPVRINPSADEVDAILASAREAKQQRAADIAAIETQNPIPGAKFPKYKPLQGRNVVTISPELQQANREFISSRQPNNWDSRDYGVRLRDARMAVLAANPLLPQWGPEFRRLVSQEMAKGSV